MLARSTIDEIVQFTLLPLHVVQATLFELQLEGRITQLSSGAWQLSSGAWLRT